MRDIKFRAWKVKEKIWLEFGYSLLGYCVAWKNDTIFEVLGRGDYDISQCIGVKDKNGKEIYEGDILSIQHCNIWKETQGYNKVNKEITFKDGKFGFMTNEGYVSRIKTLDDITIFDYEIIGNIFETPNLLTQRATDGEQ